MLPLWNVTGKNQPEMFVVGKTHFHSPQITQTRLKKNEYEVHLKQNVQQLVLLETSPQLCSHGSHKVFFESILSPDQIPGNYHLT